MRNFSFQTSDPNLSWEELARHKYQDFVVEVSLRLGGSSLCHCEKCCWCDSHTSKWERVIGNDAELRNDIQESNRKICVRKRERNIAPKLSWVLCSFCLSQHKLTEYLELKVPAIASLTVRSTCSNIPSMFVDSSCAGNIQMLGLKEKVLSPLRRLLNPLEKAPSETRRIQVDATDGNVLQYQDLAQRVSGNNGYTTLQTYRGTHALSALPLLRYVLIYQLIAG